MKCQKFYANDDDSTIHLHAPARQCFLLTAVAEPNRYALRKFSQQQYAKVAKLCNISCKKPAGLKPVQRLLYAAGRREVLIPGDGNCNFSALAVVKPGNKYSMSSMKDDLNSRQLEIRR